MMFRQEKKFTFPERYIESVRTDILKSKLLMSNTYENRFVNTLYLDSPDFVNYNENLTGIGKRSKARIRWYSKTKFGKITQRTEVFLEIKLRSNIFGTKIIEKINLPPDLLNFSSNKLISHIRKELPTLLRSKIVKLTPIFWSIIDTPIPEGPAPTTTTSSIHYLTPMNIKVFRYLS